jgi:hypothetical protein
MTTDAIPCPECDTTCPSKDHLVDHLSDAHDVFSWAVAGRPLEVAGP